jgi:hypothetical protein
VFPEVIFDIISFLSDWRLSKKLFFISVNRHIGTYVSI